MTQNFSNQPAACAACRYRADPLQMEGSSRRGRRPTRGSCNRHPTHSNTNTKMQKIQILKEKEATYWSLFKTHTFFLSKMWEKNIFREIYLCVLEGDENKGEISLKASSVWLLCVLGEWWWCQKIRIFLFHMSMQPNHSSTSTFLIFHTIKHMLKQTLYVWDQHFYQISQLDRKIKSGPHLEKIWNHRKNLEINEDKEGQSRTKKDKVGQTLALPKGFCWKQRKNCQMGIPV